MIGRSLLSPCPSPQRGTKPSTVYATRALRQPQSPIFHGQYWDAGHCHLAQHLKPHTLATLKSHLAIKLRQQGQANDPDKLHHRNAHLDQHIPELADILLGHDINQALQDLLGEPATLVRSTLIDKPCNSTWHVKWHQDKSPLGFSNNHLDDQCLGDKLVAVRIHLDRSHKDNGGLQIIEASHRHGLFNAEQLQSIIERPVRFLDQAAGEIMFMHPYIVHASSPNTSQGCRRIIHCEYMASSLV